MSFKNVFRRAPALLVVIVPIAILAPFLHKAFAVDDTVFVWVARQIHAHPADFFGFNMNWGGIEQPAYDIDKNPPGVSYYIALVSALFGEQEFALHLFFLIPAVALSLGTYSMAKRFTSRPITAALCAVLTPAFAVSSCNVMSDTMMVAFFVCAAALWIRGIDQEEYWPLFLAAFLAGCAALTKYFGIAVVPLLFTYGIFRNRRPGYWCLPLLVPLAMMGAYEAYTHALYGSAMFSLAAQYTADPSWRAQTPIWSRTCIGLAFAGGCFAVVLCFAPLLWSRRTILAGGLASAGCVAIMAQCTESLRAFLPDLGAWRFGYLLHAWFFILCGLSVCALAVSDLWRTRSAASVLLFLWVVGTFCFSTFLNWTINARTMLPMAPALGILVARRLDTAKWKPERWHAAAGPLLAGAAVALCVAWGDYAWANSERYAAQQLHRQFAFASGNTYFLGHWGFQYYMTELGNEPLSLYTSRLADGDLLVKPQNNANIIKMPGAVGPLVMRMSVAAASWISTMDAKTGTGFYAYDSGCLPFCFGPVPPETYDVYQVSLSPTRHEQPRGNQ